MLDGLRSEAGLDAFSDEYCSPVPIETVLAAVLFIARASRSTSDSVLKSIRGQVLNMGGPQKLSRQEVSSSVHAQC